jgi:hypothetical protein
MREVGNAYSGHKDLIDLLRLKSRHNEAQKTQRSAENLFELFVLLCGLVFRAFPTSANNFFASRACHFALRRRSLAWPIFNWVRHACASLMALMVKFSRLHASRSFSSSGSSDGKGANPTALIVAT